MGLNGPMLQPLQIMQLHQPMCQGAGELWLDSRGPFITVKVLDLGLHAVNAHGASSTADEEQDNHGGRGQFACKCVRLKC